MQKYEDALEQMNNAGTEYVRGISVIKTFNQSVYYFKNFYTSIMNYKEFVHKYSISWENGYSIFLALIKADFLFLLPAALLIAGTKRSFRCRNIVYSLPQKRKLCLSLRRI